MKTPTHDEISVKAHQLWRDRGCPGGYDTEIWLEAERELSGDRSPADGGKAAAFTARVRAEAAAESVVEHHLSPAMPDQEAINAAIQKHDARAPQVSPQFVRRSKPAETGKPLWQKPHSS